MSAEPVVGHRRPLLGALLVLGAAVLWGTLGVFGKYLYERGLTALEVASARAAVGALGLGLWHLVHAPAALRVRARDLPLLAAYGVIGFALFELLFFAALERTTVAIAVALLYTAPAFVLVLSWATGDERPERQRLLPLILVLLGVTLVTGAAGALVAGATPVSTAAILIGLASGLTYGLYTWFGKRAVARNAPSVVIFYVFVFAAAVLAVPAPPWRIAAEHTDSLAVLLLLGLVPTLGAYVVYAMALQHLPGSTAAMLASIEPVIAALLGFWILGEPLAADRAAGVLVIVAASGLLARSLTRQRAVPALPDPVAPP
ncbi:MAG: DMT family transporter [Longimicrobiales bacterium]